MIELNLPFPPSVNHITAVVRGRKIKSKRGREYQAESVVLIKGQYKGRQLTGRLSVQIEIYPPCRRRRDIDNYSKGVLDSISAAWLWVDDEQVDRLTIIRREIVKGGACKVFIKVIG